ncbi:hypothetical protein [Vibrio splendidus]|uniref:hypothetical protein n=1 Tax=Vibrio splendidus TaxID=29497 RepID=UPI00076A2FD5|nr:hypothetical protein [Vibrio splendidus]
MKLNLLMKFGKSEHVTSLRQSGELHMGTFKSYRDSDNCEVGDLNEGAHSLVWEESATITRQASVGTPEVKFEGYNVTIREYNTAYESARVYCMYYSSTDFRETFLLSEIVDRELMEKFNYDSVAVVFDLPKFYERLDKKMSSIRAAYKRGNVSYVDLSKGKSEVTPFDKDLRFSHQNEFRICMLNIEGTKPYPLKIGNLEDISVQCSILDLDKVRVHLDLALNKITFTKCA